MKCGRYTDIKNNTDEINKRITINHVDIYNPFIL